MTPTLDTLSAEELRERAQGIFRPKDTATHWSVRAHVLGVVQDRSLYAEYGEYASTRAWAGAELGLSHGDVAEAMRLWRMVAACVSKGVELERWLEVGKGNALALIRVLKMGGDADRWVQKAASMTEEELREDIKRHMGEDVWIVRTIRMPESTAKLLDAALIKALPLVNEAYQHLSEPEAKMVARDEDHEHQCLEVVLATFAQPAIVKATDVGVIRGALESALGVISKYVSHETGCTWGKQGDPCSCGLAAVSEHMVRELQDVKRIPGFME